MTNLFPEATTNPNMDCLDISPEDLKDKIQDVQVIDVRRSDEFTGELGHIAQATLHTLGEELEKHLTGLDSSTLCVFVCRSGGRSAKAACLAKEMGFKEVYNMAGGMMAWNEKSFPVEK